MRRITAVTSIVAVLVGLGGASAQPAWATVSCARWQVSPVFRAEQGNGLTVTFMLLQAGKRLRGTASFTQTHPEKNIFGESTAVTTFGDVVTGPASQISGNRFTVRVQWTNGILESYSGTAWFPRAVRGGGLYANLTGTTNPDGDTRLVGWQTHSGTKGVKPLTCPAASTVRR